MAWSSHHPIWNLGGWSYFILWLSFFSILHISICLPVEKLYGFSPDTSRTYMVRVPQHNFCFSNSHSWRPGPHYLIYFITCFVPLVKPRTAFGINRVVSVLRFWQTSLHQTRTVLLCITSWTSHEVRKWLSINKHYSWQWGTKVPGYS